MTSSVIKGIRGWMAVFIFVAGFGALFTVTRPALAAVEQPVLGEDGLYHHAWFMDSFMNLPEDLEESTAAGKRLVVFIEQVGCIYCKKVQTELLVDEKINAYVRENFNVLQINMWGDKEVTDFDGEVLSEKELARKWRALFTPTIVFFPATLEETGGKSGLDAQVASMPGAFGKGTFLSIFQWVKDERYKEGEHFQKFLARKLQERNGQN